MHMQLSRLLKATHCAKHVMRSVHPFLHSSPFHQIPKTHIVQTPEKCPFPWGIYTPCDACSMDPPDPHRKLHLVQLFYRAIRYTAERGIAVVILSACLSDCYVRAPWLNRYKCSPEITSRLISPAGTSLIAVVQLIDLALWRTSPNFRWKTRGLCAKVAFCDTKLEISLERSSLEPKLLQSVYGNSSTAYRLVTNLET